MTVMYRKYHKSLSLTNKLIFFSIKKNKFIKRKSNQLNMCNFCSQLKKSPNKFHFLMENLLKKVKVCLILPSKKMITRWFPRFKPSRFRLMVLII